MSSKSRKGFHFARVLISLFCGRIFALPRLVPAIFRHLWRRLAVGSLNPTSHSITKGLFPPDLAKDSSFIGRESGSRSLSSGSLRKLLTGFGIGITNRGIKWRKHFESIQ